MRKYLLISCALMLAPLASANDFLGIFLKDGNASRVRLYPVDSVEMLRYSPARDFPETGFDTLNLMLHNGRYERLCLDSLIRYEITTNVPSIHIVTDPPVDEITSKEEYLKGSFALEGMGRFEDMSGVSVKIKGRGNTTWGYPKKPYRLKFDKKISLFGLAKAKNYVLIANHLDNTQMKNTVAFRIAELLGMPYTNHSVPVNVYLNGRYRGSYMLSEKIGINSGSVDIDEETGILWELDTNYDEDFKFITPVYGIKTQVKDPDFKELEEADPVLAADDRFLIWKSDFARMEKAIQEGRWFDEIDMQSMVDYMLVTTVCCNCELSHPKSTFLYKEALGEKYFMGPVWDFDWAFNFRNPPNIHLLSLNSAGVKMFIDILKTPEFRRAFSERWEYFKENIYPQVMAYIDYYAAMMRVSALQNGELWPKSRNEHTTETFDANVESLKDWIRQRVYFINSDPNFGIVS